MSSIIMSVNKLGDGNYLIRVIISEPNKKSYPKFIQYEVKNGVLPTSDLIIKYLRDNYSHPQGTQYELKGLSALIEGEEEIFPDKIQ